MGRNAETQRSRAPTWLPIARLPARSDLAKRKREEAGRAAAVLGPDFRRTFDRGRGITARRNKVVSRGRRHGLRQARIWVRACSPEQISRRLELDFRGTRRYGSAMRRLDLGAPCSSSRGGCPSSGDLGHERLISNGGSGSLGFQSMPLSGGAASGASRWSWL